MYALIKNIKKPISFIARTRAKVRRLCATAISRALAAFVAGNLHLTMAPYRFSMPLKTVSATKRFVPPLIVEQNHIDRLISELERIIEEVEKC